MGLELPQERQRDAMKMSGWLLLAATAIQLYGTFSSTWIQVSYFILSIIEVVSYYGLILRSFQVGTAEDSGAYGQCGADTGCTECKSIGGTTFLMLLVSVVLGLWAGKVYRARVRDNTQSGQRGKVMIVLGLATVTQGLVWFLFTSSCGDKVTEYVANMASASGGTTTASESTLGLAGILNLGAFLFMVFAWVVSFATPEGAALVGPVAVVPAS